jgi:phosphatidate cytidylyltransferase
MPDESESAPPARKLAAATAPTTSRAGRNLPAAIGVGLALAAVLLITLFAYRPSFAILVGIAAVFGCVEMGRALSTAGVALAVPPVLAGAIGILIAAWVRGPDGLVYATLFSVIAVLLWRLADGADGYLRDAGASSFVLMYVPALAAFAVLSTHADDGAARIIAFIAVVVCNDTGGYATGVLFGRHPLAPIVSKGKTWEGFVGSVLFCAVAGVLFLTLTFHEAWWKGLVFGLLMCITATIGDLGSSVLKRDIGIKDWSHLLPGHGGVMDRLDSLLPCAAVAYLLLSLFAPT